MAFFLKKGSNDNVYKLATILFSLRTFISLLMFLNVIVCFFFFLSIDWHQSNGCTNDSVTRQFSVSSDSKLLDATTPQDVEDEQPQVILRQKKPPRPKSEVFLSKDHRRSKRYSAFGVSC